MTETTQAPERAAERRHTDRRPFRPEPAHRTPPPTGRRPLSAVLAYED